jgi:hypothetical protein
MHFEYYTHQLISPGYLTARVPSEVMEVLNNAVNHIQLNGGEDMSSRLAGHIAEQINMMDRAECVDTLMPLLNGLAASYDDHFNYSHGLLTRTDHNQQKLKLESLWVNFQKKHDFNPSHNHTGVYSFVIWHTIPYNLQDELNYFAGKNSRTSLFEFSYIGSLGHIQNDIIPVDKSYEGMICFFPARLHHAVYPFYTSDDTRISISGNLYYQS